MDSSPTLKGSWAGSAVGEDEPHQFEPSLCCGRELSVRTLLWVPPWLLAPPLRSVFSWQAPAALGPYGQCPRCRQQHSPAVPRAQCPALARTQEQCGLGRGRIRALRIHPVIYLHPVKHQLRHRWVRSVVGAGPPHASCCWEPPSWLKAFAVGMFEDAGCEVRLPQWRGRGTVVPTG